MMLHEIFFWKKELRRVSRKFLRIWERCPKCFAKWRDIAWDAESDHEFLLAECDNSHLFRVDDELWLYSFDGEVFAPKEDVGA